MNAEVIQLPLPEPGTFDADCERAGRAHKWIAVWKGPVWTDQRKCSTCGHVEKMPTASEIARGL